MFGFFVSPPCLLKSIQAIAVGTLGRQGGEEERKERKADRSGETTTPMHRKEDEKPSEEFWEHFFREENFQGKTLGDFLNEASPSPTAVKKREAWFDVPHRELFYKEEDLRCFRTNGTYIGDDCDPDDLEEEAAGTEQEPDQESEPPAVSVSSSADDAIRVPRRKEVEHTECQEEGEWEEEEGGGRLPGTGSTGCRPAQTPEELCLGAAAFAAASAAYGRPSSSASTPVAPGGLALPSEGGGGTNGSSEGSGKLPLEGNAGKTRSSGRSRSSNAAASSGGSGNGSGSGSKKDRPTGSSRNVNKSEGHGGLKQHQKQRHERVGGKRQRSAATGDGGLTEASVGDSSGDDPRKRRRAAGGVLAPTSSSLGRAASTKYVLGEIGVANNKDPMHRKLLEFRQKKSTTATAVPGAGTSKAPTKGKGEVSKTTSVHTVAAIQAKSARGRPASTRGRTSAASAHADAAPRAAVRGSRSASLRGSVASAAGAPARGMAGTANSTPRGVSLGVSSASIAGKAEAEHKKSVFSSANVPRSNPKTVSKPVTTVKRSVSGTGGGVGGPKSARERSTDVKRKGPTVLSSNVTDRTKRRPCGKNNIDKDDSAALSFDEDLKAKLAAHNRGVTKGRHTYEPSKGRVKDWKKWESKTGKKYYSLNPDEKADANREILAMLAAEKDG
ncbi:unnamed protein product [Ectocarpus sp. CCAP 1310/34]|nr:unnamed protein product [Ectocarpus sp. CCAP 1310/34]